MFEEQILAKLDARLRNPHVGAVAQQQPIAELRADQIAEHAPDQRSHRRGQDHRDDVELVCLAGDHRTDDQSRFARQRKADAFKTDEGSNHEQTVGVDEMDDAMHRLCTRPKFTYTGFPAKRTP
jgi:hypothetical protein